MLPILACGVSFNALYLKKKSPFSDKSSDLMEGFTHPPDVRQNDQKTILMKFYNGEDFDYDDNHCMAMVTDIVFCCCDGIDYGNDEDLK